MRNKYIVFTAIGFELVGIIIACLLIGKSIDDKFHLNGIVMILLSMLGLAGWLVHVVMLTKKIEKQDQQDS